MLSQYFPAVKSIEYFYEDYTIYLFFLLFLYFFLVWSLRNE